MPQIRMRLHTLGASLTRTTTSLRPSSTTTRFALTCAFVCISRLPCLTPSPFSHMSRKAFRYFPSDIGIISWLGAYYVESQFCEKAIQYFERASLVQYVHSLLHVRSLLCTRCFSHILTLCTLCRPNEIKWRLMVASCFRRAGNYQQAFETYKQIHTQFPENIECLRFIVRLCQDLGMKELQEYSMLLGKAEKAKEMKEKVRGGRGGGGLAVYVEGSCST